MIKSLPALCNQSVSAIVITLCLASPTWAADKLSPRAEVNVRAGTERSILMTEFWAPLAQQSDRVLYGDLRLMGDDGDNREGNLGFGYRQISKKTNSVLGANAWIDRRRTENGNNFHQITLGVESLGETVDIRANGYIQLNGSKTTITPNIGSTTPYLAGSGIFFDTNGSIVEEPQHGFDAEIGYRLPILQKYIDNTRVYAGGYHFFGDTTDNTTGYRLRAEAQVNSIFSVGARFQHDNPRGSQGFLEATLRFPFKSKKLFQEQGLKSRLDESPERDIDIVTGAKVDTGLMKPVLNPSGTEQRILYVDNTNTNVGDGTKDNPFNTLKIAEAAFQENDILYINRGDGTTLGMDQGILINTSNIQLIGSGSDLTYNGFTLLNAGAAPVITNKEASLDNYRGNGVLILSSNILVSGITVSGATRNGVSIFATDGAVLNNITIKEVNTNNNVVVGVQLNANNGSISNTVVTNITSMSNGSRGVYGVAQANGALNSIEFSNITANNNLDSGVMMRASTTAKVNNSVLSNITVSDNGLYGVLVEAGLAGMIEGATVSGITANNNTSDGLRINAINAGSSIWKVAVDDVVATNNAYGVTLNASIASIAEVSLNNMNASSNRSSGIYFNAISGGSVTNVTLQNSTLNSNAMEGLYVSSNAASPILNIDVNHVQANNNGQNGMYIYSVNTTALIDSFRISYSDMLNNAVNGIFLRTNTGVFNIDLGGGTANSAGQNRLFGNTTSDLRMNYSGGTGNAFAKYNWWGDAAGLLPGRATLNGSTTVDASNFLVTDPRP
jgi:hypothetical protein